MNNLKGHTAPIVHQGGGFHWVGDGFPVQSVFGYNDLGKELSPFLLMDYAAPYEFTPTRRKRGVGAHPHRGFETVTIAYQGEIQHRDSSGGGGLLQPGDVQWMTAASGLIHEEFHSQRFSETGGKFEMVQLWVNLPAKDKNASPGYQALTKAAIPMVSLSGGKAMIRVISGSLENVEGPAKTFTPINVWDTALAAGAECTLEVPVGHTKAVFLLSGEVTVNGVSAKAGDLVTLERQSGAITLSTQADAKCLILTGEPIDEPIVGYGPFVMNSQAEIRQAFADFQAGKLGHLE